MCRSAGHAELCRAEQTVEIHSRCRGFFVQVHLRGTSEKKELAIGARWAGDDVQAIPAQATVGDFGQGVPQRQGQRSLERVRCENVQHVYKNKKLVG